MSNPYLSPVCYRPFDNPVLCWTNAPVIIEPTEPKERHVDGETHTVDCVVITIGLSLGREYPVARFTCPDASVQFDPSEPLSAEEAFRRSTRGPH